MTRSLTAGMIAELTATVVRPCYFLEMEFSGGTERITTFHRDYTFLSETWSTCNWLQSVNELRESEDLRPVSCVIRLGGEDSGLMNLILSECYQSQQWTLYFALLDASDVAIVDPYIVFKGYFDSAEIQSNGSQTVIDVTLENELSRMQRVNEIRYTHDSQQELFSGDLGFEYVATIADWKGWWGKAPRLRAVRRRKAGNGRN